MMTHILRLVPQLFNTDTFVVAINFQYSLKNDSTDEKKVFSDGSKPAVCIRRDGAGQR
jgi:hypothetical protein